MEENRSLRQLLAQLPAYDVSEVEKAYRAALERDDAKIIVLDDDPTGVQTVHDVYVYTDWKTETLCEAFGDGGLVASMLWGLALALMTLSGLVIWWRIRRRGATGIRQLFWR